MLLLAFSILGFFLSAQQAAAFDFLSLHEFLEEVKSRNTGIRGVLETSEGARLHSKEGALLLAPSFFSNLQWMSDAKPTVNPLFMGNRTISDTFGMGVSQLTRFGLQAKLSYNVSYLSLKGVSPSFVPVPDFHDAKPTLELSQSLWRNSFGSEVRATQEFLEANALAASYSNYFQAKMMFLDAEIVFWRLALARQTRAVQKDALERSHKIYDWSARRSRLHLADPSDLLQADAALQVRKLEWQAALDEEQAASRAFNLARGVDSNWVKEQLPDLDSKMIDELKVPIREGFREDVKAAEQLERASIANSAVSLERNSPTVELYASLSLNGHEADLHGALSDSFQVNNPTEMVGLRINFPINVGLVQQVREGYTRERSGAQEIYQRKLFEQEQEWAELSQKLADSRRRLELSRAIEVAQKAKLVNERSRLQKGRTTTYQVLLFEQDYSAAQLSRIRAQAEVLQIIARMKLFGGPS